MVEGSWWSAAVGIGLGLLGITGSAAVMRRRGHRNRVVDKWRRRRDAGAELLGGEEEQEDRFVCKRVCASDRLLKRVGSFAKDVTPNSCVTVCGVSELDACAEACARAVCVTPHHVPNWNDICMKRCQSECMRSSS